MLTALENFENNSFIKKRTTQSTSEGFIIEGECYHVAPFNQRLYLELDSPAGMMGGIFLGFMSQLGKWGFSRNKVEEWMEVSPANPTYYQNSIQQKQQLEAQIKAGLAGISSAVSDFELLFHDLRKYREFMEHFDKIEKGKKENKPELTMEGVQTLKAIFIDQVDVHTGEGIALKLIAPRWPTIIADFMKLGDKDIEQKKIAEKYNVSEAEGVVLATKNKLFLEWQRTIKETVLGRFESIRGLMEARRKSIDEYKNILRPYITRYRYIREFGETERGRRMMEGPSWIKPAGQLLITSTELQTIWAWRPFTPPQVFKAAAEFPSVKKSIFRMPFPREFKNWVREEFKTDEELRKKYSEVTTSPTGIEPLDIYVLALIPDIEKLYKIKFTVRDILDTRDKFIGQWSSPGNLTWIKSPYFMVLELPFAKAAFRVDNRDFEGLVLDRVKTYFDTQNMILLRMLELKAKEKELENYISDMLGDTAGSKFIKDIIKGEYPYLMGGEIKGTEEKPKGMKQIEMSKAEEFIRKDIGLDLRLVKPGHYEPHFYDMITEIYLKEVAEYVWNPALKYLKAAVGVPGF